MNTTSTETDNPGALLKIDDVGQSLINLTKLFHDPVGSSINPGCYHREQSFIAQCLRDIRRTLTATECSLYWCINRYSATQDSGVLEESIIDSWWSHSSFDIVGLNKSWDSGDEVVSGRPKDYHFQLLPPSDDDEHSTNVHGQNISQDGLDDVPRHASNQRPSTYDPCYVGLITNAYLGEWLAKFFTRKLDTWNNTDVSRPDDELANAAIILSGQSQPSPWGTSDIARMDPVFDIFSNVASSLTSFVRLHRQTVRNDSYPVQSWNLAPDGRMLQSTDYVLNFTALGAVLEDRTTVRVRWGWLSLPISLIITTCALTVATKIRGSKRQLPVWGSSTTALMMRGPYSYADGTPLNLSPHQMHKKAQSTKVTLERGVDGSWRLLKRRNPATRIDSTDLESAVSFLSQSTTYEMTECPNPTGANAPSTARSPLDATEPGQGEATLGTSSCQQRPRFTRAQSV
ncbi:MAG: hypothetical protein Q9166_005988 [cf. Caloplaca sp. 2 TL-2023]